MERKDSKKNRRVDRNQEPSKEKIEDRLMLPTIGNWDEAQLNSFQRISDSIAEYSLYKRAIPTDLFKISKGYLHTISKQYESLDYEDFENDLLVDEEVVKGHRYLLKKNFFKWVTFMMIGFFTATVASTIDISIQYLSKKKFTILVDELNKHEFEGTYLIPLEWMGLNVLPFVIGSVLVTYVEPQAIGSGIPLIKCYLNGISIPKMLSVKTLVVKGIGLVCTITGGVASGKEGPMLHIGGCVASILSKGYFGICSNCLSYKYFRDDQESRDLVSAGAACGVSAAFGASVGGVLFSLEEGASFWNQSLTWRIFFATVVSKFTVNLIMSGFLDSPGNLVHPSLVNLGKCDFIYTIYEIPFFMIYGCLGGLMGSLWIYLNYKLGILRMRFIKQKWLKLLEAAGVASFTAVVAFTMAYTTNDCRIITNETTVLSEDVRAFCRGHPEDRYNGIASMWLRTPQSAVNKLIHDPKGIYSLTSMATFALAYYVLSCLTFGLSTSNGIFVPSLLTGASWGRFLCVGLRYVCEITFDQETMESFDDVFIPGKYALIGAVAQLGGIVRMTLSLTVIVMETSDNISFSLPIIVTLICAKWTGEFFTDAFYDILIKLKQAPFLYSDPPPLTHNIYATELMNYPVQCLRMQEPVRYVIELLKSVTHNGFPLVESTQKIEETETGRRKGKIKGFILRSQIIVMLRKKYFQENAHYWESMVNLDIFRDIYLRKYTIEEIKLSQSEISMHLDFTKFMNMSPYTLMFNSSFPQIFRLFRALGLRHLPIVDRSNEVLGIITRKDLAKYRHSRHRGKVLLQLAEIK